MSSLGEGPTEKEKMEVYEMTKDNGGQAFPNTHTNSNGVNVGWHGKEGMTLRDYFAGQALIGLVSSPKAHVKQGKFAKQAYQYADAMIAERSK